MSRIQVVLLFILSILLGLGAVYFAQQWMSEQVQPEVKVEQVDRQPIVVAALELEPGRIIKDTDLKLKLIEDSWRNEFQFDKPELVIGKVTTSMIYQDEPITQQRVSLPGEGSTLAALISEDKRAVTIRVNDVIGVGGFLLPGNKVDVMNTVSYGRNSANTNTILKDIKVLAVDQTAKTSDNKPIIVRAVTLEVSPKDAEKLLTAKSKGDIQLALRNPHQEDKPEVVRRTVSQPRVTIIKGTESSSIKVRN